MARQSHTALAVLGTKTSAYTANAADLTMTAADVANKEQVTFTGRELIIVHNTGAGAHTVTVSSVADEQGRTGDISAYSIGAGEYAVIGVLELGGWEQTDGKLYFEANHAEVKFGVARI